MAQRQSSGGYLPRVIERLRAEKFKCAENVPYEDQTFKCVAKKKGLSFTKFSFSETVFVFGWFASLDADSFHDFSSRCYSYATNTRKIPLPLGYGATVYCFPVAIVENADAGLAEVVKNNVPPTHIGSAEVPSIYEVATNTIHYLEETPLWGFVYYGGFRKMIQRLLAP